MREIKTNIVHTVSTFVATVCYCGYIPFASGTLGSFVGILFFWFVPVFEKEPFQLASILVLFFVGVYTSAIVSKANNDSDPSIVVIDEVVGMWISCAFLPKELWIVIASFFLFRLFDILKPFPARSLEHLRNGWGIMLDDVAAGMYSNIVLRIIIFFV
ncbi:MAG: phosphatidylglycerophosphatase A [Ignavibacteria bacterium]|nr:phosphatidylglycerophosphatase A [Ignavibacteria bacterium]